jgi:hypothetical protein
MAVVHTAPGQYSTFIPNSAATKGMVVDFSRNPNKFALAKYAQYVPVKRNDGRYFRMTVEQAGRILNSNLSDFAWPDGADRPSGYADRESFGIYSFRTQRFDYPFSVGELAAEQAEWDILGQHNRINGQRAMTGRTVKAATVLSTSGNYDGQTASVSTLVTAGVISGELDLSTTARKDIKRAFDYMADVIFKSTLGAVAQSELIVVVGMDFARRISVSQEIVDHIKQSPAAREELEEGLAPNTRFGLPSRLYGYEIAIEDAVKVTSRKGATKATSYVWSGGNVAMLSRPGGLEGVEGTPSFSSVQVFLKEEMTVESKHDKDNRRHEGHVVDDFDVQMVAPAASYLLTGALSS